MRGLRKLNIHVRLLKVGGAVVLADCFDAKSCVAYKTLDPATLKRNADRVLFRCINGKNPFPRIGVKCDSHSANPGWSNLQT